MSKHDKSGGKIGGKIAITSVFIGIFASIFIVTAAFVWVIFCALKNSASFATLAYITVAYAVIILLLSVLSPILLRQRLKLFTSKLCKILDEMISGSIPQNGDLTSETLLSHISHRLIKLYSIMAFARKSVATEKCELQELISDISHQVKTPIANLKMINSTLQDRDLPAQKQQEFLSASANQLDKLDFLMQSMIKTSRLEMGIISLNKAPCAIYETIANALSGVVINAEKKNIAINIDCDENIVIRHDKKWTVEALFNILDNAVKYTDVGGAIKISVHPLEMYTKIDIADNGRGIPEAHHTDIFKRFFREDEVHDSEGIGIGLYLSRAIITMQDGYITVNSTENKGSTFSVFLLNKYSNLA